MRWCNTVYLLALQAAQAQSEAVAGGVGPVDDQACQVCMRRDGPTMLLCDGCDAGYHMKCLVPRLYRVYRGLPFVQFVLPRHRWGSARSLTMICCSRGWSATMLVCDGCDQGFHMHCMGMGKKRPPPGAWFCVHCSNPGAGVIGPRTSSAHLGARAHGACATAGA
jgi:hypothetical protein